MAYEDYKAEEEMKKDDEEEEELERKRREREEEEEKRRGTGGPSRLEVGLGRRHGREEKEIDS